MINRSLSTQTVPLNHVIVSFALIGLIFLAVAIYWPALDGPFLLDDYNNLNNLDAYANISLRPSKFIDEIIQSIKENGSPGRILSFISFTIDDVAWPSNPWRFKYTNLMLHLLNGVLIFLLSRIILIGQVRNESESNYIALLATSIWLLHPLLVSTTMYVVQRMVILSALFTLAGIIFYIKARLNMRWSQKVYYLILSIVIILFLVAAILSKEIGINYLVYIVIIEVTLLRNAACVRRVSLIWKIVFLYAPLAIILGYAVLSLGKLDEMFLRRDFSMLERLITEPFVLLHYVFQILFPSAKLMSLFHDDIIISSSVLSSAGTFVSLLFVVVLPGLAIYIRKTHSFIAFCVLWFFAGHLLEASVLPLELYFEHRNYLPMLGIILLMSYLLLHVVRRYKYSLLVVPFIMSVLIFQTHYLANVWSDEGKLYRQWANNHPQSARAYLALAQYELSVNRDVLASISLLRHIISFNEFHIIANLRYVQLTCNRSSSIDHVQKLISNSQSLYFKTGALSALEAIVYNVENNLCANGMQDYIASLVEKLIINSRFTVVQSDKAYLMRLLQRLGSADMGDK